MSIIWNYGEIFLSFPSQNNIDYAEKTLVKLLSYILPAEFTEYFDLIDVKRKNVIRNFYSICILTRRISSLLDTLTCKLMFSMQNLASMISLFVTIALCSRLEHHEHGVELYNCSFEPTYTILHIVEAMKKVTGLTQFVPDIPNWVSCLWQELPCFLVRQWVSVLRE